MKNENERKIMDKEEILNEIFENDPLGLLQVELKSSHLQTAKDRLLASFEEINDFVGQKGKEPQPNSNNISEFQLYSRLKNLRADEAKKQRLKDHDIHHLLALSEKILVEEAQEQYGKPQEINSIEDLLAEDPLNLLGEGDSEGLFDFKHTPKEYERAHADFVARRKVCPNFDPYKALFQKVQKEIAEGKRSLIPFKGDSLRKGDFYVHNGVLLLLEKSNITQEEQSFSSGKRIRKDGRTLCVFENGTESKMLYRSLAKILYVNGSIVTQNVDEVNETLMKDFNEITSEDEESGTIYVLKSKSTDEKVASIRNLYKIGYCKTELQERIKNAEKDPTYLMAPVSIQGAWKCFNMNPQKLEQLLHQFFGYSCLELDIFDEKGKRHTPREWFIAPILVIEQAIKLIITGEIVNYSFDVENHVILKKD